MGRGRGPHRDLSGVSTEPCGPTRQPSCAGGSLGGRDERGHLARKSTEQIGVAEEAKSVTRQIDNAKAFALKMGWSVADAHVFVDDGISGAEFEARPGLQRLLAMAETRKPPFQRLVVSEQKSIGREMGETGYTIKRLAEAGIEIFEYVHGHRERR